MPWDEYVALGRNQRSEYIDGHLVVSPSRTLTHQTIARRLANAIEASLPPGVKVATEWAWKPADDEFVSDVLVLAGEGEDLRYTHTPYLAVEILSDDRGRDLIRKFHKYAEAGLPRYWIIDSEHLELTAYTLVDGTYVETQRGNEADRIAVDIGPATVVFTLALLADRF
jgi:Uma2 family endonuclease